MADQSRRAEPRRAAGAVLNWLLALALGGAADLVFPAIQSGLAGARRAGAAAGRGGARAAAAGGASCWAGRPAWSTGSASATGSSSCSRSTAAWATWPAGRMFLLFCVAKALHMGVFALLAGILMRRWWAVRRWPRCGWRWKRRTVLWASPGWRWAMPASTWAAAAPRAVHRRLRTLVRLRHDVGGAGAGGAAPPAAANWRGWLLLPLLLLLPPLPAAERGHEAALLVQPNISETEEWTPQSLDQHASASRPPSPCAARCTKPSSPPSIVVWPEVPAPFYYDEDPRFRDYVDNLARTTPGVPADRGWWRTPRTARRSIPPC